MNERVKKELENERRITRLKQVREKSNHLARKIRQEVAEEKTRQIRKLEQIKNEELNAWRQHVLVKKHQDYRSAVFQVGAAHRAAQAENEKNEQQKQQRADQIKKCRRLASKRACKHTRPNATLQRSTAGKDYNVEGRATACTQTPAPPPSAADKENRFDAGQTTPKTCNKANCYMFNSPASAGKRKRRTCCRENPNCQCESSDDDEWLSDTSHSSVQLDESDEDTTTAATTEPTCGKKLQQTPAIILDVDRQSEDSLLVTTHGGIEIHDRFMQSNRQFSRVVRPSPESSPERRGRASQEERAVRPHFTQISDLVRRGAQPTSAPQPEPEPEVATPRSPNKSILRSPQKTAAAGPLPPPITAPKSPPKAAPSKSPTKAKPAAASTNKRGSISQQQQPPKRSSLRATTAPPPAKVIDAGLKRSSTAQPRGSVTMEHPAQRPMQPAPNVPQPMQQYSMPQHMQQYSVAQPTQQNLPQPIQQSNPQFAMPQPTQQSLPQPMQQSNPQFAMPQLTQQTLPQPMQQSNPQFAMQPQSVPPPAQSAQPNPQMSTTTQSSVSTTTFVMRRDLAASSGCGARVQFYDYNNKFHKNYEAPAQAVQITAHDPAQLSAMDHARIENQLRQLREQELDKLRQISQQRGQKALEREQVRRDCAELTEKLEALNQQQPQLLPSDANFIPSHRFADLAARREVKMNEAMEQMLLRPAIITCPEVELPGPSAAESRSKSSRIGAQAAVNVGARRPQDDAATVTSESCCSILLDYVDDQSKQLRGELKATEANTAKSEKLKSLLARIEKIRSHLLDELKAGSNAAVNNDNVQEVIDSIRKERATILEDKARTLDARESDLQEKEALLERRLRQLYNEQKKTLADGKQTRISVREPEGDKPLEIIIKVKSDGTVKQCVPKLRGRPKATKSVAAKSPATITEPSTTQAEQQQEEQQTSTAQRQNSYDSNSTSYRSLPPVLYKGIQSQPSVSAAAVPLNPLIAQYVQRLLSMTRNSIQELGVSSSDVATPSSSIINNSRNMGSGSLADETLIDERRMQRVQTFIQDNRSFINELEDTLRNQSQSNAEHSLQALDQIWTKRLEAAANKPQVATTSCKATSSPAKSGQTTVRRSVTIAAEPVSSTTTTQRLVASSKTVQQHLKHTQVTTEGSGGGTTTRTTERRQWTQRSTPLPTEPAKSQSSGDSNEAARQMERYAKLTENCTLRIAELTELITKVREEKQRLVEVTLTSASEGERHSTEYFELPVGRETQPHSRTISECTQNTTPSTSEELPLSNQEPLQKHKPTGASRDSGISVSRPVTAQGLAQEVEPSSLTSSTQSSTAATQAQMLTQRRGRVPPPTLRRYSPHTVEEDLAHELSTIVEVETPAQSHIMGSSLGKDRQRLEPVPFPTFEQYAQELQLDLSQIHPDQSFRLQQEFNELVLAINQRGDAGVNYREFPSINAYLHNMTTSMQVDIESQQPTAGDRSPQTVQELVQHLRLVNVNMRSFPSRREYVQQRLAQQPQEEQALIDSASLEEFNDTTDSFNVEAELRERRILKNSFQRGDVMSRDHGVASSTRRESAVYDGATGQPNESGIDQLSITPSGGGTLSSDMDREMQRMGMHWPTTMRQRQRQAAALSSDTTDSRSIELAPRHLRGGHNSVGAALEASELGRSLNLREFLTRELLKHRARSENSTDSSDDSLKSNFLQSVIDSLGSPNGNTGVGHGTGATNDRQKTSTPRGSLRSRTGQDKSTLMQSDTIAGAADTLFSGESRLSSVHYPDGTPPVAYEQRSKTKTTTNLSKPRSPKSPDAREK